MPSASPAGAMGWDELREAAGRVPVDRLREREALLHFDDPSNLIGGAAATPRPTGSASRCRSTVASAWSSGNLACTTHGAAMVYPAEAFEPEATPAAVEAERCQDRQLQDPRFWRFVDEFPMIVTGKVQKFKMRETSVAELGLEGAAGTPTA